MNALSHRVRDRRRTSRMLLASLLTVALTGCVEQSMSDLEAYSQQVLARKGSRVDELPPIEPYEVYTYSSSDGVDPFEPFYKEVAPGPTDATAMASGSGITPNFDRNKEELESFALDSLRMMGTLETEEKLWGIVRSPDGTVHRVKIGNYMGRNHGKVVGISEESINLNEIVQNGQGGWQERDASLALVEQ
jgi:type IV pilus assembly protein PilP